MLHRMRPLNLLIALNLSNHFDREVFIAIARHAHYNNVSLRLNDSYSDFRSNVAASEANGIIISTGDLKVVEQVAALGLPSVNIANCLRGQNLVPVVGNDDAAVGRMAAKYYLEADFRHFAYFEGRTWEYFLPRREAFVSAVRAAGFECHLSPSSASAGETNDQGASPSVTAMRSAQWLASLPRPLAVFCPYDGFARDAIHACHLAELRVPEEISVMGVDDDPILCMTVSPPIASIATATTQIGLAALDLVQAMIRGGKPPSEPLLFAPTKVVARGSCSDLAIDDADVAAAASFIRVHHRERLTVATVSEHLAISRRTLERKFLDVLGRTPSEEIQRVRLAHAKRMLIDSDLELPDVARQSGMIRAQRLATVLKRDCGLSPRQFRQRFGRPV